MVTNMKIAGIVLCAALLSGCIMCLTDDDPRYRATTLRKDNCVTTIENR
jgi:hypothetical protein